MHVPVVSAGKYVQTKTRGANPACADILLLLRFLCLRQEELTMSFEAWIVLGLVAGFIGSQLCNRERIPPDVIVGISGVMAGGRSC
jgi:hypothetical protein